MSGEQETSNVTQGDVMYGSQEETQETSNGEEIVSDGEQGSEDQEDKNLQEENEENESSTDEGKENPEEDEDSKDEPEEKSDKKESKDEKEEIEYDLKLSKDSLLKEETLKEIEDFAKENKLSNESAQQILKREESLINGFAEDIKARHEKQVDDWYEESVNDPEIGGDKLKETSELSKRAIEAFGSSELAEALRETGYGNNPVVVKFLSKIGKAVDNDRLVLGGVEGKQTSRAETLYGNN